MVNKFKQGDIIFLDFGPQSGHEQRGSRPALVISCDDFNLIKNFVIAVPITSTKQNSIFSFKLGKETKTQGYVLCDQLKALDVNSRHIKYLESVSRDTVNLALSTVRSILSLQN